MTQMSTIYISETWQINVVRMLLPEHEFTTYGSWLEAAVVEMPRADAETVITIVTDETIVVNKTSGFTYAFPRIKHHS